MEYKKVKKNLYSEGFGTSEQVIEFINTHGISKKDILAVTQSMSAFELFYYAPYKYARF